MAQQDMLVVVNAAAGSASDEQVQAAMAELNGLADLMGAVVDLVSTADLQELTDTLNLLGDRRLVVLGGDGSVHAAVQGLHDSGRLHQAGPIGIIPLGTGNDLARWLGIPCDPGQAARVVMTGTPQDMDLLIADDGQIAVNAVHVGIGAAAAAKGARAKHWLGKIGLGALGYRIGALAAGLSHTGWRLQVNVDGTTLHGGSEPVLMVVMGLGGTVGGGAEVAPGADPRNGLVDVVVSLAVGPLARLGYARQVQDGGHKHRSDVRAARGRTVDIHAAPGETFSADGDGELRGPFTSRRWQVERAAWQVIAPARPETG